MAVSVEEVNNTVDSLDQSPSPAFPSMLMFYHLGRRLPMVLLCMHFWIAHLPLEFKCRMLHWLMQVRQPVLCTLHRLLRFLRRLVSQLQCTQYIDSFSPSTAKCLAWHTLSLVVVYFSMTVLSCLFVVLSCLDRCGHFLCAWCACSLLD